MSIYLDIYSRLFPLYNKKNKFHISLVLCTSVPPETKKVNYFGSGSVQTLTHLFPMQSFLTPEKHQKTFRDLFVTTSL